MKSSNMPVYNLNNFIDPGDESDFYCNDLAAHLKKFAHLNIPHKNDYFLSILFTNGKGTHEIDFIPYHIKPGTISMIAAGQVHNSKFSSDVEGIVFLHTAEFYDLNFTFKKVRSFPFFCSIHNTSLIKLNPREYKYFKMLYHTILNEYKLNSYMSRSKISSLVDILYTDATRIFSPGKDQKLTDDTYLKTFIKLEELVGKNYVEIKSPTAYAELLHLTERHVNRICKNTVNKTLSDVIQEKIMLEAKRMLAKGDKTIIFIAEELGYDDPAYFSRLFKKKCGMSASDFSKRYKQIYSK